MTVALVVLELLVFALAVRADYRRWHRSRAWHYVASVRPPDNDAPVRLAMVRVAGLAVRRLDDDS